MKRVLSLTAAALVVGAFASPAVAQQLGNPVYVGGGGMGVTLAADFGLGVNDDSGKDKYLGGRAVFGASMVSVNAGAGYLLDSKAVAFGANVAVNFLNPPGSPVKLGVYAGGGYSSKDGISVLSVPAGVVLTISPPTGMVEFWIAPGIRYTKVSISGGGSGNSTDFGGSAGVNISMLHVALDYTNISGASPFLVGAGVHFTVGTN